MADKFLFMLGLAAKAGRTVSGEKGALEAVRNNEACLCVLARDAAYNTKKRLTDKCAYRVIDVIEYGSREELGKHTGKEYISVVCIKNKDFAVQLKKLSRQS